MNRPPDNVDKSVVPMLPPMHRTKKTVKPLAAPGQWEVFPWDVLDQIADSLRSKQHSFHFAEIVSVPDVWAQVEVFRNGLLQPSHPLHKKSVGQWRGLLSVIATSRLLALPIEMKPLKLSGLDGLFAQIASHHEVLPAQMISNASSWDEIAVILHGETAVGLLNPATLVCPSASFNLEDDSIPWLRDGVLRDPLEVDEVTAEEFAAMTAFLENARASLSRLDSPDVEVRGRVDDHLSAFLRDCRARVGPVSVANHFILSRTPKIKAPQDPVYDSVRLVPDPQLDMTPSTLVPARPDLKDLMPAVVAIDRELSDIGPYVWPPYSLDLIHRPLNEEASELLRDAMQARDCIPVEVKDRFFTKHLVHVDNLNVAGHPQGFEDYLLPLTARALYYLTPEQIRNDIEVSTHDHLVTVSLTISIGDERVRFERTYDSDKGEVVEFQNPTNLVSWPQSKIDTENQRHFVYYGGNPKLAFGISTAFSAELFRTRFPDSSRVDEALEPDVDFHTPSSVQSARVRRADVRQEIHRFREPVEAFLCADKDDMPIGILLNSPSAVPVRHEADWQVGIDFGTSNTTVYCRRDQNSPQAVDFDEQLNHAIGQHTDELGFEFIPPDLVSTPFLTVFRDREWEGAENANPRLLLAGNIYYRRNVAQRLKDLTKPDHTLKFNLKWGEAIRDNQRIGTFLDQVITQTQMQLMREGASGRRIKWRFSYPTAFTQSRIKSYKGLIKGALKEAGADGEILMKAESLSSALYFSKEEQAAFTQSVITVDIGGHTSDVAIWQQRRLLWHGSLEFAAQNIVTKFLAHYTHYFDTLGLGGVTADAAELFSQAKPEEIAKVGIEETPVGNAIEAIVNSAEFRREFEKHLPAAISEKETTAFARVGQLALAGLMYYFGLVINKLSSDGHFDKDLGKLTVCFGGQGSLLWQQFEAVGLLEVERLASLLADVAGFDRPIEVKFSRQPKHEVAYGLLVDSVGAEDLDFNAAMTENIGGEIVRLGSGHEVSADGSIENAPEERMLGSWHVDGEIPVLRDFVDRYARVSGHRLPIDDWQHDLCATLDDFLADQQARIRDDRQVVDRGEGAAEYLTKSQPIFVRGIRALVSRSCQKDA